MPHLPARRPLLAGASAVLLLCLAPVGVAQASPAGAADPAAGAAAAGAATQCARPWPLESSNFSAGARIDNRFLPMRPGTRMTYQGTTVNDAGKRVRHSVVFTVTDLVKKVDGVTSRVIYDVDVTGGQVVEAELAFFAQDDRGTVWNLGEYPEEYENGTFTGAPSTWISGQKGAVGGIHMLAYPALPQNRNLEYLQGRAPAIDFLDCARVARVGGVTQVPAGRFTNVLTTYERSPLESTTAIQTKEHAPGVGIVRIGALNDPEGEDLALTEITTLTAAQQAHVDKQVRALDRRGYRVSDVYASTGPLHRG